MVASAPPATTQSPDIGVRRTRLLVLISLVVAIIVFILSPALAIGWSQRVPFPGVLVGQTFIIGDSSGTDWRPDARLDVLDRIVAIDGFRLTDQVSYDQALIAASIRSERQVRITFERPIVLNVNECGKIVREGIRECEVTRPLRSMTTDDLIRLFGLPYVIGLAYLAVGIWVFRRSRTGNQRAGLMLSFFCVSAALVLATFFDQSSTNSLLAIYRLGLALASGSIIGLGLTFPLPPRLAEHHPLVRYIGFVPGLIAALIVIARLYDLNAPWDFILAERWLFTLAGLSIAFYLVMLFYRWLRADSPVVRQQSRIILLGSILSFLPFIIWVIQGFFNPNTPFVPLLYLPAFILFPISIAYALQRYGEVDVDRLVISGLTYILVSLSVVSAYLILLAATSALLRSQGLAADNPILLAIFILLVAVGLDPVRQRIQHYVDRFFFRGRLDPEAILHRYSHDLTEVSELPAIVSIMRQQVTKVLKPQRLYVYLLDARTNAFVAQPDPGTPRLSTSAAHCAFDGPIARWLKAEAGPRYIQLERALPEILRPDLPRLEAIGAVLYVPLMGRAQLSGWLALSHKLSGQPYSTEDLSFLSALADQTAVALERAIVFDDVQRRVNELNVLSRVSQAVNFTLDTDDILELIYTQTSKVLDTRNFYVAMADVHREMMRFSFYIEGGERLYPDDEWPVETGLSGEIMRRGQPIITDDYVQECIKRGLAPGGKPGQAWMGVPLNAGDRPFGIMAVSDFRPEVSYSEEQLQIFAAIADQAASVLDKARLYRETEERARQLAVLNEVGSSITSSLDLRTVLSTIVQKAIELLHAEAGSLLLVDEHSSELVFEVTFGPAADDLRGQRLPFGKGIVGAVAQTRRPQIVNEAQRDVRWLRDVDKTTAFSTRAILAVPMINKDRVIGVLELINKLDSDRYTEEDQNLLTAFANTAAVAVENARLFTMTDQALAARLQELSTLQEIDHQLNTSLDIQRVLELTLDWGLRVTDATAGSAGIIDREQNLLILLAKRNYTYQPTTIPLDQGLAGQVIRSGQPVVVNDVTLDSRYIAAAPSTRSQLSVPIRRENEVLGVLNLESSKLNAFGILQLDTAIRLADHAVSAVINAQLYEEVTRANQAKGRFVSEVAHELGQPLTAIKGFSELVIKGMAGPMTDMQSQFLSTIHFNAERMIRLDRDLLDIGRIETRRLKLEIGPNALKPIIEATVQAMQAPIDERQITVEYQVPDDLPRVMADRDRLIQILTNLVSNAYKYTPVGGRMTIRVTRLDEIQPRTAPRGNWTLTNLQQVKPNPAGYLACAVQDTGFGISSEDQGKLFTQFFRSHDPAVREQPGTGLGLSITKSLIELQQGAIWVESEVGKGSTFAFSLPLAENGGTG